jgi:hypothetical protein
LFSLHVEIYREKLLWAIFSENSWAESRS